MLIHKSLDKSEQPPGWATDEHDVAIGEEPEQLAGEFLDHWFLP